MLNSRNWPNVPLGEIAKIERAAIPPQQIKTGTTYVGLENIDSDGKFVNVRTVESGDIASAKFTFNSRHILFGKLRPYLKKIARPTFDGVCSTDILPILPSSNVDRGYLYHYLRQQQIIDLATARSAGANLPRISPAILAEFPIPLPPLAEQRRIAEILDRADALREKRRKSIAMLDTLVQSVFLEMFGDPVTNPKRWPITTLSNLLTFLTSGSRGWASYYSNNGSLFLRIQNVGRNRLILDDVAYVNPPQNAESTRTRVKPGDVLLSITADLGRSSVIPNNIDEAYINQHLAILRVKTIEPEYLSAFIASSGGQRQISRLNREGVKAGLNFDDIRSLMIPLPPRDLQSKFIAVIENINKLITQNKISNSKMDDLFFSLQHQAFNGTLSSTKTAYRPQSC